MDNEFPNAMHPDNWVRAARAKKTLEQYIGSIQGELEALEIADYAGDLICDLMRLMVFVGLETDRVEYEYDRAKENFWSEQNEP